ncbi:MAG: adenosylmethionine--8-amino-7-oxononanoate transaminase [Deltaproteobacteria bacterium]|nr:adenosylmethionine--8-amino-7-oxononanoate transaminase [Deltaproteobacteria bacterium]
MTPRDWVRVDLDHVWHPFTQMQEYRPEENLIIARGDGRWLEDVQGRRFFDGVSSLWTCVHGHRHPALDRALLAQAHRLAHSTLLGAGNVPAAALAERLAGLAPGGLRRVFFSDDGSTAVEVALKMCFQGWRQRGASGGARTEFVALSGGYHGDTLGAVAAGGMELFHGLFHPLLFHTHFLPSPDCYRCPAGRSRGACAFECARALGPLLDRLGDTAAALIVEPMVQGAGGQLVYPPEVLRIYREETATRGIPLVADEVATGFGRTGRMFAVEHAGVEPDLMTVAKGLSGGYLPVAATLAGEHVYASFLGAYEELRTFFHGHTFTGNPLGCAVALANLDEVESAGLVTRVRERGPLLEEELRRRLGDHPRVGDIRLLGFMGGVELVADRTTKARLPLRDRTGHRVILAARNAGLLLRPLSDVLVIMPPLASTDDELEFLVDGLAWAVETVLGPNPRRPRPPAPAVPRRGALDLLPSPRCSLLRDRILVTGTDTGVGKTVVAAALGLAARSLGRSMACWKPVESGATGPDGDDQALYRTLGLAPPLDRWPTAAFPLPVSPHLAAAAMGSAVDTEALVARLRGSGESLLVEGAGGLLVPLDGTTTWADVALRADLAALVVAPDRLGCLNQVFSAVYLLRTMGIPVAGVVLNRHAAQPSDASTASNAGELARVLGEDFLGTFPGLPALDPDGLRGAGVPLARRLWTGPEADSAPGS